MFFFTLSSRLLLFLLTSTIPIDYLPEILIIFNKFFSFQVACESFYGIIIRMNIGVRFRYFLIPFSNLTKGKREILCSQTLL